MDLYLCAYCISLSPSGADISIVVRDALMQPVRKVQTATHFLMVGEEEKQEEDLYPRYLGLTAATPPGQ